MSGPRFFPNDTGNNNLEEGPSKAEQKYQQYFDKVTALGRKNTAPGFYQPFCRNSDSFNHGVKYPGNNPTSLLGVVTTEAGPRKPGM